MSQKIVLKPGIVSDLPKKVWISKIYTFKLSAAFGQLDVSDFAVSEAVVAGFGNFWMLVISDLTAYKDWLIFSISSSFRSNSCMSVSSSLARASVYSWCIASTSLNTPSRSDTTAFRPSMFASFLFFLPKAYVKRWN